MTDLLLDMRDRDWREALDAHLTSESVFVRDLISDARRSRFLEVVPLGQSDVVLDIGCGFGGIALQVAECAGQVVGLDYTLERVQFLREVCRQERRANVVPVCTGDVLHLPFLSETFSVVYIVGVMEYFPLSYLDMEIGEIFHRFLCEVRRVLRPGGYLYIGTKNRYGWQYLTGSRDHNQIAFGPALPRFIANVLCQYIYKRSYRVIVNSRSEYRNMLDDATFVDTRFYWTLPGYQTPDYLVPLDKSRVNVRDYAAKVKWGFLKRRFISVLSWMRLLPVVVPYFGIVSRRSLE